MLVDWWLMIVVCALCLIYYLLRHFRSNDSPPAFPGYLPIVGHAGHLLGGREKPWNFIKASTKFSVENDNAVAIYLGPLTFHVITDIDDCLKVANTSMEKATIYKFANIWLGDGLITASAPIWKQHRKLLNTAFSQQVLDGFMSIFNNQARRLCQELEAEADGLPFDHGKYLHRSSLETIYLAATGMDLTNDKNLNKKYIETADSVMESLKYRVLTFWLHNSFFWNFCSEKKIMEKNLDFLLGVSNMIIKKRKENDVFPNELSGQKLKTLSDVLFNLEGADGKNVFTDQHVRDHVNTFIVAGYDTVGITLLYTILLIASYPRVQNKIYAELKDVFGTSDSDFTKQDLSRLVYLEAVIKESARLYPVVPIVARSIEKNIKLKNSKLYAGNTCIMSIYGINRHPMWGPDADDFVPERWLDPTKLPSNPNYFATFSFGKRNCIGKTYAIMWMKILLAHVLRQYEVNGDHTKMVNMFEILLKPVSGHLITIQKRNIL